MEYKSLCQDCIYGQFLSGNFIHGEDYYTAALDKEDEEPWKQSLREETYPEENKEKSMKMCVSFCFFPVDLTKLQPGQSPAGKEFHDIVVKDCNRYKRIEV
jgi:hypothetical protein